MKNFIFTFTAASLFILTSCSNNDKHEEHAPAADTTAAAVAPATEPASAEAAPDSAAMAKAWETYMTPGDMHKWLASTDGKWKGEMTSWMGPDAPPTPPSKLSAENKMILGGRYQESVYKGKMMGMDFEGRGVTAYDNAKKKFITTWVDNMGTGVMYLEGPYDENTKTITMTGKMTDPSTGKDTDVRRVLKTLDDKTQLMEMYCNQNGKEFKNMEIKLTKN